MNSVKTAVQQQSLEEIARLGHSRVLSPSNAAFFHQACCRSSFAQLFFSNINPGYLVFKTTLQNDKREIIQKSEASNYKRDQAVY